MRTFSPRAMCRPLTDDQSRREILAIGFFKVTIFQCQPLEEALQVSQSYIQQLDTFTQKLIFCEVQECQWVLGFKGRRKDKLIDECWQNKIPAWDSTDCILGVSRPHTMGKAHHFGHFLWRPGVLPSYVLPLIATKSEAEVSIVISWGNNFENHFLHMTGKRA